MTGACLTGCSCVACRMRELLSADHRRLPSRLADTLFQRRGALSGVVLTCGCLRVAEIYRPLALTVNLKSAPNGGVRPRARWASWPRPSENFSSDGTICILALASRGCFDYITSIRGVGESFVSPVDGVRTSIGL